MFDLPSASVLESLQQKRQHGGNNLFALAQSQAEGLPKLVKASDEVRVIAEIFNTQALIDSAATESAFKARASTFNLIHLAAHGQLNSYNPLFSRIFLAPDGDNDGSLEVHEIYRLDLTNVDLVFLSACQTQLGEGSRGDDIISLNRAFIYAGSPTVIGSLWEVDDTSTSDLVTTFYTHLKQGKSKAAALQAAQAQTRSQYPHPYYWAAFVLTGDPGI